MKGGYRYTVRIRGSKETHAVKNLYASIEGDTRYTGLTVCGKKARMGIVDEQATCEKCIELLRNE